MTFDIFFFYIKNITLFSMQSTINSVNIKCALSLVIEICYCYPLSGINKLRIYFKNKTLD